MRQHINDINVVKTCYEYFKSISDMVNLNKIPFPCTEYQTNLKELNKSPIESWLEQLIFDNWNAESVKLLGKDAYISFKKFCESKGIVYEINALKLGVRIKNIKIGGIEKRRHINSGETKLYMISRLKTHFKLGFIKWRCLMIKSCLFLMIILNSLSPDSFNKTK